MYYCGYNTKLVPCREARSGTCHSVELLCRQVAERCSRQSVCSYNFLHVLQAIHALQILLPPYPPISSASFGLPFPHYPGVCRRLGAGLVLGRCAAASSEMTRRVGSSEGGRTRGWLGRSRAPASTPGPPMCLPLTLTLALALWARAVGSRERTGRGAGEIL